MMLLLGRSHISRNLRRVNQLLVCTLSPRAAASQSTAPRFSGSRPISTGPSRADQLQHLHSRLASPPPTVSSSGRHVVIAWNPQCLSKFHNIWLRDHCRCPECFHPITKQRLLNTFDIPRDIKPIRVESKPEGLTVTWPATQSHVSVFPWSWLKQNSYDPPMALAPTSSSKVLWGNKIAQSPPTVTYEEVMEDSEEGLYRWLTNIDRFGFSFVTGVPVTPTDTQKLAERIGFIRETQYGTFWDFTSDLAKGDTAYTNIALGAHTDNTYYTDPCGLQLFHLLSHTHGSGGATLLVDGFHVASILKELHPEAYRLLSTVPVPAHAAGEASAFYTPSPPLGYPILRLDPRTGEVDQVRWNNDDRSVMNHLEPHLVEPWYDAIRIWYKSLTSPDSEYWVQLQPSTAVVVDNHRVLHGRSAFSGRRRMCGAYIGVDEYQSKLTVLRESFSNSVESSRSRHSTINSRHIWHPGL
ncbi:hypothetical protein AX16_002350 [Volvariella volvacea WC 439]|nr:hypothetical protein AX16_002350 [Volvariella volvacea WC 439]